MCQVCDADRLRRHAKVIEQIEQDFKAGLEASREELVKTVSYRAHVPISSDEVQRRELNRLWGYRTGDVPLDVTGPSPHRDAAYRVAAGMSVSVDFEIEIHKDGTRTVKSVKLTGGT